MTPARLIAHRAVRWLAEHADILIIAGIIGGMAAATWCQAQKCWRVIP